jgi:cytochrome c-type biogenesis protein CcmH
MCTCSTADQIKSDIKTMIAQGMSEDDIIKSFVAQHGDTVLAAPPKKGFQLTAWMVPFAAFLLGGVVLIVFLKRNQGPPDDHSPAPQEPTDKEKNDHYRKLLDEELEKRK